MKTPGSWNSTAPRRRNSAASRVLPQPAPPHTKVGRPRGKPPSVISSKPLMPVGHLGKRAAGGVGLSLAFLMLHYPDVEVDGFPEIVSPCCHQTVENRKRSGDDSWVPNRRATLHPCEPTTPKRASILLLSSLPNQSRARPEGGPLGLRQARYLLLSNV